MREEKKYEILPGVELPDLKTIREAASDFSVSEVGDVDIREVTLVEPTSVEAATTAAVSPEELAKLKNLGDKVAEDEAKAQAESKAKMDEIVSIFEPCEQDAYSTIEEQEAFYNAWASGPKE